MLSRRRCLEDSERDRARKGEKENQKSVGGPPIGELRGGGTATSTPGRVLGQPAAAVEQPHRAHGRGPQRVWTVVPQALVSTSATQPR